MPQLTAALIIDLAAAGEMPEGMNAHIFPDGAFKAEDGRPASLTQGELKAWRMDAAIAAALVDALAASGKPILYDYEHKSLYGDSRAAGWIDALAHVPGRGLFAHVDWTPDAVEAVAKKVYRYSSPFFSFDRDNGEVSRLLSVALTNTPALPDLSAVDLTRRFLPTEKEAEMADKEDVAALVSERDGLKTTLAALTAERDTLKTERDAATTRLAEIAAAEAAKTAEAEKAEHAALMTEVKEKGLLAPVHHDWAAGLALSALRAFVESARPLAALSRQTDGKGDAPAAVLSPSEAALCQKMGVSPEAFIAAKKGV
ncbi:MAG: phage protease [Zoogloeaceae bacterium]|jgi:phage I-like protein|nr:phage protease [Zoogloeaceae bacterium]